MESYRSLLERALTEEPEGLLVADFDGRAIGAAIARVRGTHPVTGEEHGRLEALTVAPAWRAHGSMVPPLPEVTGLLRTEPINPCGRPGRGWPVVLAGIGYLSRAL